MGQHCITTRQLGHCGWCVYKTEGIFQGGLLMLRGPSIGLKHSSTSSTVDTKYLCVLPLVLVLHSGPLFFSFYTL